MNKTRFSLKRILLGKPLQNSALEHEKLSTIWGVPIMASDAVSSVAYALEEILMVLVPVLGLAAVSYLGWVALPIIFLLMVLVFSYSQIIDHYPNGGGAYIVSAENLGPRTSLVAAAALIIDYVMTVAVSISSATAAFLAAFPELMEHRVLIALICLCLVTLINLRGVSESSKVFGAPTYAFIATMGILIITGLVRLASGHLDPIVYHGALVSGIETFQGVFIFLLLRAFASGCSALTGVEAVSNAVPNFKKPAQKTAKHVLYILGIIIMFLFGGSVLLATHLQVMPLEGNTVIAQMGRAVFGPGIMFYILQFTTSLILILAANTAYNGLPTLLAILAQDGYLPRQFLQRGAKLSFSNGIMFLFVAAGFLLIVFQASTHHLIPLYSVGVFISFTLSQFGMVLKWLRKKEKGWLHGFCINGFGALMTSVGMVIVFWTKFSSGAWMLGVAIPIIVVLMSKIKRHYSFVVQQLKVDNFKELYHPSVSLNKNLCVVLVSSLSRSVLKCLNYANSMSSNVVALHISTDNESTAVLQKKWQAFDLEVPLTVIEAPYRDIIEPLENYLSKQEALLKHGEDISVITIRFVVEHWYEHFLHNQTTYYIEQRLSHHKNLATIIVPYLYKI